MPCRLNDLTSAELLALREAFAVGKTAICPYCSREFVRHAYGQAFCNKQHQRAWHNERGERAERALEKLQEEFEHAKELWREERAELVKEISRLKDGKNELE